MNTTNEKRGSNVTPFFLGVLGFLVYYGLFSSFDRTRGYTGEGVPQLVGTMWKLGIFSITMWRVGDAARTSRKLYLTLGGAFAVSGSALLLAIEMLCPKGFPPSAQVGMRFMVEGIEAIGEAFICAGLVAHVREKTIGKDWRYFRVTTALRVGQNTGMVLALLFRDLWTTFTQGYAIILLGMRVGVGILLLQMIQTDTIRNYPRRFEQREKAKITWSRLLLDVIVGASSYALFYLVAMGPSVILKSHYAKVNALALNGAFAMIAMVAIYLLAGNANKDRPAKWALLKIEIVAAAGGVVVIAVWMISFVFSISGSTFLLISTAGLLGLFTTSTYVLSELSSGLYGKPKNQSAQIVAYFGLARLGPIIALVMILLTEAAKKYALWSAVAILEVSVALGCAGIVLGVLKKWKLEEKTAPTQKPMLEAVGTVTPVGVGSAIVRQSLKTGGNRGYV